MALKGKRKASLNRRKDGTFGPWKGGKTLAELPKKENNFHGIAVHIGKEYARQHGRPAKVGEAVRFKTKTGKYHEQAFWYVRTPHGWRRATHTTKPTAAQIRAICANSRKGQP